MIDEKKTTATEANEVAEETTEKGFTAYLKIYGRSKLLTEVYDEFEGDADELTEEELNSISKYLQNLSAIPDEFIYHCVLKIEAEADDDGGED